MRVPAEIHVYLRRLCDALGDVLGERLVAAHALGGLALGDYRPGSSDLDVYAIVRDRLDDGVKRAIARACSNDELLCPARELELVVITAAEASTAGAAPRWELNLNTGRDRADQVGTDPAREPAFWFVLDLAIARQSAVTLAGADARELVGSPSHSVLAAAQADAVAWYAKDGADLSSSGAYGLEGTAEPGAAGQLRSGGDHVPVALGGQESLASAGVVLLAGLVRHERVEPRQVVGLLGTQDAAEALRLLLP